MGSRGPPTDIRRLKESGRRGHAKLRRFALAWSLLRPCNARGCAVSKGDIDLDRIEGPLRRVRAFTTVHAGFASFLLLAACVVVVVAPIVTVTGTLFGVPYLPLALPQNLIMGAGATVSAAALFFVWYWSLAEILRTNWMLGIWFALETIFLFTGAIAWLGLSVVLGYRIVVLWSFHAPLWSIAGAAGLLLFSLGFCLLTWRFARMAQSYLFATFAGSDRRRLLATVDRKQATLLRGANVFLGGGIAIPTLQRGAFGIRVLNVVRSILAGIAPLFVLAFMSFLATAMSEALSSPPDDTAALEFSAIATVVSLFTALVAALLAFLSRASLRGARSIARFSLDAMRDEDPRPPILFLRPFKDDQVGLTRKGGDWLAMETKHRELDHILVEEFSWSGPVVAIGRPGQDNLPFGAARTFLSNDDWQAEALKLAASAGQIVMVVDDSPGVQWEIMHVSRPEFRKKTLFLLHPRFSASEINAGVVSRLCAGMQTERPRESKAVLGLWFDDRDEMRVLRSSTFSIEAYTMALRDFFRSRPLSVT